jgi:hypothetical protein
MSERNEKLEKDILDELKKTGYPTEVVSSSILQQQGWGVTHNPSYRDDLEGSNREYDIRAYKSWRYGSAEEDSKSLDVFLLIECKKSEKPWVFFTTNESHNGLRLGSFLHTTAKWLFTSREKSHTRISDELLRQNHHYFQSPRLARTFYEPFKKHEKSDVTAQTIYSAVMSAIKATLFHVQGEEDRRWPTIYYPVIIFSGSLFEAIVSSQEEIELLPSKHIQLSFNYIVPADPSDNNIWTSQKTFIVDILHENYINEFLRIIEEEHAFFSDALKQSFMSEQRQSSA